MNQAQSTPALNPLSAKITAILRERPVIIQLLRFAAIGSLNTALDFVILNFVTKSFSVTSGLELGILNVISFTAAIIQSYVWNRAWTFSESSGVGVFQNAFRLVMVGGLGFLAFAGVVVGAAYDASSLYFLMILGAFVVIELLLWKIFKLSFGAQQGAGTQFATFLIISLVGLVINSSIVVLATYVITPGLEDMVNADTIKNVAKIVATAFSLIWNFIGYKLFVFKK